MYIIHDYNTGESMEVELFEDMAPQIVSHGMDNDYDLSDILIDMGVDGLTISDASTIMGLVTEEWHKMAR